MKMKILFLIAIFIAYYVGNSFGVSVYYYLDRGEFQSSVRGFGASLQEVLAGFFSSLFTFMILVVYHRVAKERIFHDYIVGILIIFFIQFMANWKETVHFQISEVPYILSYVFINIEFVTFCITSYLMLKILKKLS